MKYTDISFVDVETTGLDPEKDKVVEISVIRVNEDGTVQDFETLVNPGIPIDPTASAVHDIVDSDVENSPRIEEIEGTIFQLCMGSVLVSHNMAFDSMFLKDLKEMPWICTFRLARKLWPEAPGHALKILQYWLKIDMPSGKSHRAGYDTRLLRLVFDRMRKETGDLSLVEIADFASLPVRIDVMPFGKHKGKTLEKIPAGYIDWLIENCRDEDVRYSVRVFRGLEEDNGS